MVKITLDINEKAYKFLEAYSQFVGETIEDILGDVGYDAAVNILHSWPSIFIEPENLAKKYGLKFP